MIIAVTYENGEIFQHFGHTQQFKLYKVEDNKIIATKIVNTEEFGHEALAGFLRAYEVSALVCGGIGGGAQMALAQMGIQLFGGVSGNADQAVESLLAGNLVYDPDVHCDHHDCGDHEEGHDCGHGEGHHCGSHEDGHECGHGEGHSCGCHNDPRAEMLENARKHDDAYIIMTGDFGGTVYLTCPVSMVKCSADTLSELLLRIDLTVWESNQGAGRNLSFESHKPGDPIVGGMGGGVITDGLWLHPQEVEQYRADIEEMLFGA